MAISVFYRDFVSICEMNKFLREGKATKVINVETFEGAFRLWYQLDN